MAELTKKYDKEDIKEYKRLIKWYYNTYYPEVRIVTTDNFFSVLVDEINTHSKIPEDEKDAITTLYIRNIYSGYDGSVKKSAKRMEAIWDYLTFLNKNPETKKVNVNGKFHNYVDIYPSTEIDIPFSVEEKGKKKSYLHLIIFFSILIIGGITFYLIELRQPETQLISYIVDTAVPKTIDSPIVNVTDSNVNPSNTNHTERQNENYAPNYDRDSFSFFCIWESGNQVIALLNTGWAFSSLVFRYPDGTLKHWDKLHDTLDIPTKTDVYKIYLRMNRNPSNDYCQTCELLKPFKSR